MTWGYHSFIDTWWVILSYIPMYYLHFFTIMRYENDDSSYKSVSLIPAIQVHCNQWIRWICSSILKNIKHGMFHLATIHVGDFLLTQYWRNMNALRARLFGRNQNGMEWNFNGEPPRWERGEHSISFWFPSDSGQTNKALVNQYSWIRNQGKYFSPV